MSDPFDARTLIDQRSPEIIFGDLVNEYIEIAAQSDHEGHIPYMYLDSAGHLTVGVGHLMIYHPGTRHAQWTKETVRAAVTKIFPYGFRSKHDGMNSRLGLVMRGTGVVVGPMGGLHQLQLYNQHNTDAAQTLLNHMTPGVWGQESSGRPALTPQASTQPTIEILTEDAIKILGLNYTYHKKGDKRTHTYGASHYASFNRFEMTNDGIDSLAFDDALDKIAEIRQQKSFKDFADFPHAAQLGVLDLAYQYGAGGLAGHAAFAHAVAAADWTKAAANVPSGVANEKRTEWRRQQFKDAATAAAAPRPRK